MTPHQLAASHLHLVDNILRRHRGPAAKRWHDDLHSAALEALWEAARRYQPDMPGAAPFGAYARWRINGAIIDELRRLATGRTTHSNGQPSPSAQRQRNTRTLYRHVRDHSDGDLIEPSVVADHDADPARTVDRAAATDAVRELIQQIPNPTDRAVAVAYIIHGQTLAQIGQQLGVTESRICQRMTRIKPRLTKLAVTYGIAA